MLLVLGKTQNVSNHLVKFVYIYLKPQLYFTKFFIINKLHEKCSYSEFFWSAFPRICRYSVSLPIKSESRKTRTRKTLNTDSFHAVIKWKKVLIRLFFQTNSFCILYEFFYKPIRIFQ